MTNREAVVHDLLVLLDDYEDSTAGDLPPPIRAALGHLIVCHPVTPLRVVAERLRELTEVSGGGA